jgi:hypothetical protein
VHFFKVYRISTKYVTLYLKKLRFWSCREKVKKFMIKGLKIRVKNLPWCRSDELKIEKEEVRKFTSELCELISH